MKSRAHKPLLSITLTLLNRHSREVIQPGCKHQYSCELFVTSLYFCLYLIMRWDLTGPCKNCQLSPMSLFYPSSNEEYLRDK